MRTLLAAALFAVASFAAGQETLKPVSIAIEPLGDSDRGVVTRVFFRFANPRAVTDAGLFLEASFHEAGHVPRNFRVAVPRKHDKFIWNKTTIRNGKVIRHSSWAVLPDKRNEMSVVHTFAEGETEISAWLVLETDDDGGPVIVAKASQTFTVAKINRPYVVEEEEAEEEPEAAIEDVPESMGPVVAAPPEAPPGAVAIHASRRDAVSSLYVVRVDAEPAVKRVEFRVEDRKVLARNAPPYVAELDLGDAPEDVTLRAIGFDAAGRYVDADACAVHEIDRPLLVTITHTNTPDGFSHFKLTVRNRTGKKLAKAVLYAGDKKLQEWDLPPFALSVPTASLAGVESVRASVIDEAGYEATDVQALGAK
jgi:hypothetical protein